jgi:hypothetical protein
MAFSKDEYVARYAKSQGIPVDEVERHLLPTRCDCDDPGCAGWQMVNVEDVVVLSLDKARHYVLILRRVLMSKRATGINMVDRAVLDDLLGQLEMQSAPHDPVTLQPVPEAVK